MPALELARQGRRTALTEATTRASFVVDALAPATAGAAVADLVAGLGTRCPGARVEHYGLPRP